jgi:HEAT repeat protein
MKMTIRVTFSLSLILAAQNPIYAAEDPPAEKPVAELAAELEHEDAEIRLRAIEELADRGGAAQPALDALRRALQDSHGEIRAAAAKTLGKLALEPEATIPALMAALADETPADRGPVWVAAALALGRYGEAAVPQLREGLKDDRLQVRRGALVAIHQAGSSAKDAAGDVIAILRSGEPQTLNFALGALMGIGPDAKEAVPLLIETLSSDNFHTQYWACRALGAIGPDARTATDSLVQLMEHGVASVRHNAAAALGNIGPAIGQRAVEALIGALADRSQSVRQDAVIALGKLKPLSTSAVAEIERRLQLPSWFVPRAYAARTLWILDPESTQPMEALLADLAENDEPWVAAEMFGEIAVGDEAVDRLSELLNSESLWTRQYSAVALREIGRRAARAQAALEPLLEDDVEQVREAAAEALRKIAE